MKFRAIASIALLVAFQPGWLSQAAAQNYVTGRYHCVDASDSSDRGSCDITTDSPVSCQAARQSHNQDISSRGDPCVRCIPGQIDNTRRWNGQVDWIHGGPCQGM